MVISRVFGDSGQFTFTEYLKGIEFCADNGARVINMSLGGGAAKSEGDLIAKLVQTQNMLVVASAGNAGNTVLNYPASYPDSISVAAVSEEMKKADFSNFNNEVDISGPGVGVLSTIVGNQYASFDGTSMSSPHVAGAAAKIWAARPQCTNKQVREALEKTAKDLGAPGESGKVRHHYPYMERLFLLTINVAYNCPSIYLVVSTGEVPNGDFCY
jgi:serine protease